MGILWTGTKFYGRVLCFKSEAKVAQLTEAKCDLTEDDVIAYARLADKLLHLPIFYLEYSGTYGDVELVKM